MSLYENIAEKIETECPFLIRDIPALVKSVVESSNDQRFLYHGIKNPGKLEYIKAKGLMPLTPESGPSSFWSTGIALFHPDLDSPFFNYSGGSQGTHTCELNMAVTNYSILADHGLVLPKYAKDNQVIITQPVPFEAMALLNIKVNHSKTQDHRELRQYRQYAEQMLLKRISEQLSDFAPGKIIETETKIYHDKGMLK